MSSLFAFIDALFGDDPIAAGLVFLVTLASFAVLFKILIDALPRSRR